MSDEDALKSCLQAAGERFFEYNGPKFRDDMRAALAAIDPRLPDMSCSEARSLLGSS